MQNSDLNTIKKIAFLFCFFVFPFLSFSKGERRTKDFVAFSMKNAEKQIEEAIRNGNDFRKNLPEVYYLGGISKPWAVLYDERQKDWVLIGERDHENTALTLDDWVVALKARFLYPDEDPGVSIDPRIDSLADINQLVRFMGGISNTRFGEIAFEADWQMKKLGMNLLRFNHPEFKSSFDLTREYLKNANLYNWNISSRYWFFPILSNVTVVENVAILKSFKMGVFTEIMSAKINGETITDLQNFQYQPSETFAQLFTKHYSDLSEEYKVLKDLEGMTKLAALAKGLTETDSTPVFHFWLNDYKPAVVETPKEVPVLKQEDNELGYKVKGGVDIQALVQKFGKGDLNAFKEIVSFSRNNPSDLIWEFSIETNNGMPVGVKILSSSSDEESIYSYWQQANFLIKEEKYEAAITIFDEIISKRTSHTFYYERARAHFGNKNYDQAIKDLNESLAINQIYEPAYFLLGLSYYYNNQNVKALINFNESIRINPNYAKGYMGLGIVHARNDSLDQAIKAYSKAIELNPQNSTFHFLRATQLIDINEYEKAREDLNQSIKTSPNSFQPYYYLAKIASELDSAHLAIKYLDKVILYDQNDFRYFFLRGQSHRKIGMFKNAVSDFTACIQLSPPRNILIQAILNRADAYSMKGFDHNYNAIKDYSVLLSIDSTSSTLFTKRGHVYSKVSLYHEALKDFTNAIKLDADNLEAILEKALIHQKLGEKREALNLFRKYYDKTQNSPTNYTKYVKQRIKFLSKSLR